MSKSGRPPLSGDKAMTLEEQRERKRGLQQLVRKNVKLRKVRQLALSCRKDRQGSNPVLTDEDEDLFENVEPMEDSNSNPAELPPPAPTLTDEVSSQQIYKGSKVFKALLPSSSDDQLALLASFVESSDPNFSFLHLPV